MSRSQLSLKWLEVFQLAARHGSIKAVTQETGLSIGTVSHHLSCLEEALDLKLMDRTKRPMVLTSQGAVFLPYVEGALNLLSRAETEVFSGNISETRNLRFALIEDFDSEITPEITRTLASSLPNCEFQHFSRPSHEIIDMIRNRHIDIGVATQPLHDVGGLVEFPLLRDPFVLAVPANAKHSVDDYFEGRSNMPFLRYSQQQIIGARIETQLRRMRIRFPKRHEFESNQTLLGLVAGGDGWTITTPTNYARALRFQSHVKLLPFPGSGFARYLSVYTTETFSQNVVDLVNASMRRLLQKHSIRPTINSMPWLKDTFHLLPETMINTES